jgi:hypothetical protein
MARIALRRDLPVRAAQVVDEGKGGNKAGPCATLVVAICISALAVGYAEAQDNTFITKENAPPAFGTKAQEQVLIANICGTQLAALGAAGCVCLAEAAMTGLDDPQREYLILSVVQPPAADRTPTARSQADLKTIATFLDKAGKDCAAPAGSEPAVPAPAAPAQ